MAIVRCIPCQKSDRPITKVKNHKLLYSIFSISTLLIGILIATFLLPNFPAIVASPQSNEPRTSAQLGPQFDVDVIYAYAGPYEYPSNFLNGTMMVNGTKIKMQPASLYPDIIYFNFTHRAGAEKESVDAKTEVYLVEISSDTGITERFVIFFGTNYNPDFGATNSIHPPSTDKIDSLIDTETVLKKTGLFYPNMVINESCWFKVGTLDTQISQPSGLGLWKAGEPHSITVRLQRIGWLTLTGTVTSSIQASSKDIVEISLTKSGQGFLYNSIPKEAMSQTDAFHPIDLYKPLS
ncbi:MAG: hypothetical protein NWE95_08980 [Candidatus Bathyarchaeota archaeon]|nr:hypothetical protein [Candidatus Bathyarchaeota archaeon]